MNDAIHVKAIWDEEAHVWVAQSDDVVGLVTEAETLELLVVKLASMIPELLELNGLAKEWEQNVPLRLLSERRISLIHSHQA